MAARPKKPRSTSTGKSRANNDIGKHAQAEFEKVWKGLGKRAFCQRLRDAADLYGLAKGKGGVTSYVSFEQPADYVVAHDGKMHYAEVKGTTNKTGFSPSKLEKSQVKGAKQTIAAGCDYFVYILKMPEDKWYKVPAQFLLETKATRKWAELEPYAWSIPK